MVPSNSPCKPTSKKGNELTDDEECCTDAWWGTLGVDRARVTDPFPNITDIVEWTASGDTGARPVGGLNTFSGFS